MPATFYIVGTPIGHLKDVTLRALETLKLVDLIYCEDTRRTIKLLNHYEIKKPLISCPHFKEQQMSERLVRELSQDQKVAYVSDAGMPGLNDPGAKLVSAVRSAGYSVEVIGGVSSLTNFIAGLGVEIESFRYIGFLPARAKDRVSLFTGLNSNEAIIFLESPHRIESTLELMNEHLSDRRVTLAKELTKISEKYFTGRADELRKSISSFKGEWIGCFWPNEESQK